MWVGENVQELRREGSVRRERGKEIEKESLREG